jgi:5-methylcytosine-specific restriction enzyme B
MSEHVIQSEPTQKILFGSPGTGKSYQIREIAKEQLGIKFDEITQTSPNVVKSVFHPEYTYSDFMGKLLPLTNGNNVIYKYYPGHFLQALGKAYRGLINNNGENYLLVIDELNRGNAAAIFGSIFQLLDREDNGWSSYGIDISEMEYIGLLNSMNYKARVTSDNDIKIGDEIVKYFLKRVEKQINTYQYDYKGLLLDCLYNHHIKIPSNLSIIATINTSDESIYYLDSAFKRRWDWEYIKSPSESDLLDEVPDIIREAILFLNEDEALDWYRCILGINEFIKSQHQSIRKIEDKQIGWWFIKPKDGIITLQQVKDKLMFYLWDSVFARDKKPLVKLFQEKLEINTYLVTYADFVEHAMFFLKYMYDSVDNLASNFEDEDELPDEDEPPLPEYFEN